MEFLRQEQLRAFRGMSESWVWRKCYEGPAGLASLGRQDGGGAHGTKARCPPTHPLRPLLGPGALPGLSLLSWAPGSFPPQHGLLLAESGKQVLRGRWEADGPEGQIPALFMASILACAENSTTLCGGTGGAALLTSQDRWAEGCGQGCGACLWRHPVLSGPRPA